MESSTGRTEHWHYRVVVQLLVQLLFMNFSYEMPLTGLVFLLSLACSLDYVIIEQLCSRRVSSPPERSPLARQEDWAAPTAFRHGSVDHDTMWSALPKLGDTLGLVREEAQTLLRAAARQKLLLWQVWVLLS